MSFGAITELDTFVDRMFGISDLVAIGNNSWLFVRVLRRDGIGFGSLRLPAGVSFAVTRANVVASRRRKALLSHLAVIWRHSVSRLNVHKEVGSKLGYGGSMYYENPNLQVCQQPYFTTRSKSILWDRRHGTERSCWVLKPRNFLRAIQTVILSHDVIYLDRTSP